MAFPIGTDLFQLLWYPRRYENCGCNPKIEIHWRKASALNPESIIEPVYQNHEDMYVVHECSVEPEDVAEFPYIDLLTEDQKQQIWTWEEANGAMALYQYCLSTAPEQNWAGTRSLQAKMLRIW